MRKEYLDRTKSGADEVCKALAQSVIRSMGELKFGETAATETLALIALMAHEEYGIAAFSMQARDKTLHLQVIDKEQVQ